MASESPKHDLEKVIRSLSKTIATASLMIVLLVALIFFTTFVVDFPQEQLMPVSVAESGQEVSEKLSIAEAIDLSTNEQLKYGYALLTQTDELLGPLVSDPSMRYAGNALQCTSCHLNDGAKDYAISLVSVDQRFPQYRGREDKMGTLADRINGCFTRSMNGRALAPDQSEMKAIIAYIEWLDDYLEVEVEQVKKGLKPIELPNRAVNLQNGAKVYAAQCALCHQPDGQGLVNADGLTYTYPPLWGPKSYNNGAGMNRLITAAQFIKYNMPFGISYENPVLTDEEAYDVAGYMNQQKRPLRVNLEKDFPDRIKKPVSTPYGPYADEFSIEQHQLGPYQPIIAYYEEAHGIKKKN
jgi:thiosulfate dehydrogenase